MHARSVTVVANCVFMVLWSSLQWLSGGQSGPGTLGSNPHLYFIQNGVAHFAEQHGKILLEPRVSNINKCVFSGKSSCH